MESLDELFQILLSTIRDADLKAPKTIVFGQDSFSDIRALARKHAGAGTVFLVTGGSSAKASGLLDRARAMLVEAGVSIVVHEGVDHEPTVAMVDAGAREARSCGPSLVVGLGGGSVIDCAKAVAALATNEGSVEDYLEGVGRGFTLEQQPLPFIAVPTTAGTGAEMTKNSVVSSYEKRFKKSMRDERMIPDAVILDPVLTTSVPAGVTAAGGMDTVAQLIEPCISVKRTPATTELAHAALTRVREALPRCYEQPDDIEARAAVLLASAISGTCLANSGLALAHGIASGLGARQPVAHGLICGILLPHTLRFNCEACRPELEEALRCLLNEDAVTADTIDRGIAAIEEMNHRLEVPPDLAFLELRDEEVHSVAEDSMGSSMSGNPRPMDHESTYAFLRPLC